MPPPLINLLALGLVAGGILCFFAIFASTRAWRTALGSGVELWLAAGLLRLAAPPSWSRILVAASIVAIRKLVRVGLRAPTRTA